MAGDKKRIRFTENELNFLENLIYENKEVLDTKDSDAATVLAKKRVWWTIEEEFNNIPHHTKRTVVQLQKCWDNMKTRRKKEVIPENGGGEDWCHSMSTTGGTFQTPQANARLSRSDAVTLELESRIHKNEVLLQFEEELHSLRKEELEIRKQIALEELNRAQMLTQAAVRKVELEQELLRSQFQPK